jgi:site-specific DNA recombinase
VTVAIYARVSTDEQAKHGYSLQEQIRQCRAKAGTDNVLEYIDEGITGEVLDRPALSKLRKDVRDGLITKVICLDPDRLSRNLMNALIITEEIEKRAELVFINGTYERNPEGKLFYQMRGAIAEFEKAKINERMSRGRREKARQGKVVRDYHIYGYDYDETTGQLVINEREARVVQLIFDLFTKPNNGIAQGINGIAKYLTAQGIPTKRNARVWHRQVVRQVLMNRVYTGEFIQNRWNTEGMLGNKFKAPEDRIKMKPRSKEEWIRIPCPVIIDQEQFAHAQKLLAESQRRWAKKPKNQYLLSGLCRCGECGNTMTGRKAKNWGTYVFQYTDIKNTAGAKHKGCGNKVNCEDLDNQVWATVHTWLTSPDEVAATVTKEQQEQSTFEELELERLNKELERVQNGKQRLLNVLADGDDILIDDIKAKLRELKEKEQKLLAQKEELQQVLQLQSQSHIFVNVLQDAVNYYLTLNPDEITFEQKRELISMVVREVRVFKDGTIQILSF